MSRVIQVNFSANITSRVFVVFVLHKEHIHLYFSYIYPPPDEQYTD